METAFKYRNALPGDLKVIVDIYNSTIPGRMVTADLEPVSIESRLSWFNEHSPDRRPLWIVEKDDRIIGWISFQDFYGRPAYNATSEISIYIHEDHRGKGYGKILLDHAIAACPTLKIKNLLGYIFAHNETSLKLFHSRGFEDWGHLPGIAELDGVERSLKILGKKV